MQEGREGIRIPSELGSVGVGGEGCAAASATDDHEEGHTFHPATEERRDTEKRLVRRMSVPNPLSNPSCLSRYFQIG